MKIKTIEKIIEKKFNEYLESIKDEKVKNLVKVNTIITGGSLASMLLNEKVNDFDLYFTNKITAKAVSEYYLKIFNEKNQTRGFVLDGDDKDSRNIEYNNSEGRIKIIFDSVGEAKEKGLEPEQIHELGDTIEVKAIEGELYRPIYLSSNAITLSGDIQLIIRFYGEAEKIHENYDFVHCTNYWTSFDYKVHCNQKALECLLSKELFYIGSKYPLASMIRLRKFISRGWQINAGQMLKIALQMNEFDLSDPLVLEDQLVGVDLAYFMMLIEALKESKGEKLTSSYIGAIIDKIF